MNSNLDLPAQTSAPADSCCISSKQTWIDLDLSAESPNEANLASATAPRGIKEGTRRVAELLLNTSAISSLAHPIAMSLHGRSNSTN